MKPGVTNDIPELCKDILDVVSDFEHWGDLTIDNIHIVRDDDGKIATIKATVFGTSDQS